MKKMLFAMGFLCSVTLIGLLNAADPRDNTGLDGDVPVLGDSSSTIPADPGADVQKPASAPQGPKKKEAFKIDPLKMISAAGKLTGSLAENVPAVFIGIRDFKKEAEGQAVKLRDGFAALKQKQASMSKEEYKKEFQRLYLYSINLTVMVMNLMNNVTRIVKAVAPVINAATDRKEAQDAANGLILAAKIMKLIVASQIKMRQEIEQQLTPSEAASVPSISRDDVLDILNARESSLL